MAFQDALSHTPSSVRIRLHQLDMNVCKVIFLREEDIVLLFLVTVCLLVGVTNLLLFQAGRDLNSLQEANAKPDVLRASMVLERQGKVAFVLVLPSDDGVSLALEVVLARNEPA